MKPSPKPITASPDDLNNYFSDIAENLTGKSPEIIYKSNLPDENYNIFTLKESNYIEIRKELKNIRNDCSTGFDCIPPDLIKPVSDYLASPLMHIINNCIKMRKFPKLWKTAKICPIPKISSPTTNSVYRPISILPILLKIFERVILSQLKVTLEHHHVLNDTQSGYCQGHTCVTILHKLNNDTKLSFKKGDVTLAVTADYSKAFDTVNYSTLITKLCSFKFSYSFVDLIMDYLSDHQQYVQIDHKKFNLCQVKYGVPQGSILGLTLFNIYVHELTDHTNSSSIQFADDSAFYRKCKAKQLLICTDELTNDLISVEKWSEDSNLIFNAGKTKSMLFSTQEMSRYHNLHEKLAFMIYSGRKALERTHSTKLLGVIMREHLKWNDHVNELLKSSFSTLCALKNLKRLADFKLRKNLTESLI